MRAPQSLRSRLAILIVLLVSLLCWLLGSLIGQDSSRRIREEVGRDLAEISFQMVERLDRDMANRAAFLQVLGGLGALRQPNDIGEVRLLLDRLQHEIPSIAWIGLADAQGQVLASSDGVLEGASIAQRPVFVEGSKGLFIGDVHEAVLLAKLLPNPSGEAMKFVDISLPLRDDQGRFTGVLASHLSWSWAEEVRLALLEPIQDRRRVEFLVLSKEHSVLLGPKAMIGQTLALPALASTTERNSYWAVQRWPDGQSYLTGISASRGYQDYAGLGWIVVARQAQEEAYAPVRELIGNILMWGGGLALLFAAAGWLLSGYITQPLRRIAQAADRLSAGEPTDIPLLHSPSEIASLSQSIHQLVESLTHQQRALDIMEDRAHSDPLTGLANRAALERYLPLAQQEAQHGKGCLALLYLDLDGFKPVNDRFGHAAGDLLLKEVARRLGDCLRDGDLVARLGGDEFLMVLQVSADAALEQAQQIAERALQALGAPVELGEQHAQVGCSIGGALWPLDSDDLDEVLELADQALYRAKAAGKNRAQFQPRPAPAA